MAKTRPPPQEPKQLSLMSFWSAKQTAQWREQMRARYNSMVEDTGYLQL